MDHISLRPSIVICFVAIFLTTVRETHQKIEIEGSNPGDDSASTTVDGTAGNIKFSSPSLSDDDDSIALPASVRCDGCRTLAYQIREEFDKAHSKKKSVKVLPESDFIDILDQLCSSKFEGVGLKNVDGITMLSGPGLESLGKPGMLMGGGRWPQRMRYLCGNLVGEFGEEEIYNYYLFNRDHIEDNLCKGSGVANSCSASRSQRSKKDEF